MQAIILAAGMRYEFLKQFDHRMKNVGLYCALFRNSFMKETWTKYGVVKSDEQFNIIFALMLYLMEQSLKEENCTMDDIAVFLDNLNSEYFHKKLSYAECKELGDFIVNTILSNDGKVMAWLKKNGFSEEKNKEFAARRPFLPYSLLLSEQELKKLREKAPEIHTSFPVPIMFPITFFAFGTGMSRTTSRRSRQAE